MFFIAPISVGIVFLVLTLVTFAVCRRQLNVNTVALLNLCVSLLLAYIVSLIVFTRRVPQIVNGFRLYISVSACMWMLIDAVLLFISAKNLTKLRSSQREMFGWKSLIGIGYGIPVVVMGIYAAVKYDADTFWGISTPVYCIISVNIILFVIIFIYVALALKKLNQPDLQRLDSQRSDKKIILSVLFKTIAQFFIIGCSAIACFVSTAANLIIVFAILLQSVFIFLVNCVFNREVREKCIKWMMKLCKHFQRIEAVSHPQNQHHDHQ